MTKKELSDLLSNYPDDIRVIIDGYEGGYKDIARIVEKRIVLDYNRMSVFGPHENLDMLLNYDENDEKLIMASVPSILISRN